MCTVISLFDKNLNQTFEVDLKNNIGRGSYSSKYGVVKISSTLCIKIFDPQFKKEPGNFESLMSLNLPTLCRVHSTGKIRIDETITCWYMIMDFYSGGFIINSFGSLTDDELKIILKDILFTIDALYKAGYCHIDLHTNNVMFDENKRAKIIDIDSIVKMNPLRFERSMKVFIYTFIDSLPMRILKKIRPRIIYLTHEHFEKIFHPPDSQTTSSFEKDYRSAPNYLKSYYEREFFNRLLHHPCHKDDDRETVDFKLSILKNIGKVSFFESLDLDQLRSKAPPGFFINPQLTKFNIFD